MLSVDRCVLIFLCICSALVVGRRLLVNDGCALFVSCCVLSVVYDLFFIWCLVFARGLL